MNLTVGTLTGAHHGLRARVTLSLSEIREGILSFAANPSYRRHVRHWWLIVPSALPHFKHDALSLQWSGDAAVETLASEGMTDD
jgi:hypothetical protein